MHKSKWIVILFFSLWISSLHATVFILDTMIWHCDAHDYAEKSFIAFSNNEWSSLRDAMKLCKKESKNPKTCKVSREDCDALMNGLSIRPWWQCKAMDALGYVWI